MESWKQLKDEAIAANENKTFVAQSNRELKAAEKELKKYDTEVSRTIDTFFNLGTASVESITQAQKQLKRMMEELPRDSDMYQNLDVMLGKVTQELENIKATKAFEQLRGGAAESAKSVEQLRAEAAACRAEESTGHAEARREERKYLLSLDELLERKLGFHHADHRCRDRIVGHSPLVSAGLRRDGLS